MPYDVLAKLGVALCAVIFASQSFAQDIEKYLPKATASCAGELEKRHQSDHPWDFTTNSRKPTPEQPTVYLHCIFNNDPSNVVDVNWLIPGVSQPIPGNRSAIGPKYSSALPLGYPEGCLIFGNLRDKSLKAQFWARPEDTVQLENEKGKDCLALPNIGARAVDRKTVKLIEIVAPFRMFLRADPSSPKSPLITFEGITGVRTMDSRSYENYITYRLRSADDVPLTTGESPYVVEPRWNDEIKLVLKSIVAGNKGYRFTLLSRKESTTAAFEVRATDDWFLLRELEYVVLDQNAKIALGSVYSPIFVPYPPR
jgi:hypothetical protein